LLLTNHEDEISWLSLRVIRLVNTVWVCCFATCCYSKIFV